MYHQWRVITIVTCKGVNKSVVSVGKPGDLWIGDGYLH